ncbi:hypothetical protein BGW37DRAFT_489540 [Umbelopsis sp. PMI_123]|jgi:hypothetical protein|nr:hypothetical protein BGW37DRAFT_489540 [Umbelopsis sp. PMI_123]
MYSSQYLVALATSFFLTAQAVPITRSEDPFAICNGFELHSLGFSTVKVGQSVDVKWETGSSLVENFSAIELFNSSGLIKDLYVGHTPATEGSKTVNVEFPENQGPNGNQYWFRIWGRTSKGPDCILISDKFNIDE